VGHCNEKHFAKGMCHKHYLRDYYLSHRDPVKFADFKDKEAERIANIGRSDKTCSKCGVRKPKIEFSSYPRSKDNLHSWCKACLRKLANDNYDPERAARLHAERQASPEYRAMKKTASDRWHAEHPDKAKSASDAWREANPERYQATNRAGGARRRSRVRNAPGSYTIEDVLAQYGRQKGRCFWCHGKVDKYHVDHVVPLARGGSNGPENIVIACPACNLSKNAKHPMDFAGVML
jgi:5-methylcytosine-specific restriction endonuclease McrA